MLRGILTLCLCLGIFMGAAIADSPELDAKKQEISKLTQQMGAASSVEEWEELNVKYKAAVASYQQIKNSELAGQNKDAACASAINSANSSIREKNYVAAKTFAEQAIEQCVDSPKPYYSLGQAEKKLGNIAAAKVAFESAIAKDNGYYAAWIQLSRILARDMNKPQQAKNKLDEFIANNGGNAKVFYEKGTIDSDLKNFKSAIVSLKKAVEANPAYTKAWLALTIAYNETKQASKAINAAKSALSTADSKFRSKSEVYYHLAVAYNMNGEYAKAETAAENCLKNISRQRKNKSFIQGGANFEKATSFSLRERFSEAKTSYIKAQESREWKQSAEYEIEQLKREHGI
jgi:tetratricopeptide (TPR) repeat protein